jgi:hypothetical protein
MINFRDVVLDTSGSPIKDVEISVYDSSGINLASTYDINGNALPSIIHSARDGEFEFYAHNGKYILHCRHQSFNEGLPKLVHISLFDPDEANFISKLIGTLLDSNQHVLMDNMPFRIWVTNSQAEMLSLASREKDIVIRRDLDNRKFLKLDTTFNTMADWVLLDIITRVAGRTGDIVLTSSDITDFDDKIESLKNQANGIVGLTADNRIPDYLMPNGGSILNMVDEVTGTQYRLVINNGEIVVRPLIGG